jgi:hypothetical protein
MSYKTFLGATAVVQSYDNSGINPTSTIISPVDNQPKDSFPSDGTPVTDEFIKPQDVVATGEGGDYRPKDEETPDDNKSSFSPTLIIGILAIAYFLFKKKK